MLGTDDTKEVGEIPPPRIIAAKVALHLQDHVFKTTVMESRTCEFASKMLWHVTHCTLTISHFNGENILGALKAGCEIIFNSKFILCLKQRHKSAVIWHCPQDSAVTQQHSWHRMTCKHQICLSSTPRGRFSLFDLLFCPRLSKMSCLQNNLTNLISEVCRKASATTMHDEHWCYLQDRNQKWNTQPGLGNSYHRIRHRSMILNSTEVSF